MVGLAPPPGGQLVCCTVIGRKAGVLGSTDGDYREEGGAAREEGSK